MKELEKIINYLIKEKGGTKEQYLDLLKKIGYHESAHTMDPTIKQIGGGPGRGIYQFEEGQNAGGITAARRTKQYLDSVGASIPKWLKEAASKDSLDATKLSAEQQGILFLGNMRKHPKADLGKVVNGEESIEDFWANYHWAGDPLDRKNRINSFKESISTLPEKKIYNEPLPPARITPPEGHITNPTREYINPLSIPKQYKTVNKPIEGPSQMNLDPIRANIGSFEGLIKQINQKAYGGTNNTYYKGGYINPIDPDPTNPKKPLNKSDIKNIQRSTGIMFNNEGANQLFERNNKFVKPNYADDLNLGKYKGLDYFDITKDSTGYILNPTKKNIRGPEAHRDTLLELQKLNPNIIINQRAYTPMSNRMAYGGLENSNCGGPGQPPCKKKDERYQNIKSQDNTYVNNDAKSFQIARGRNKTPEEIANERKTIRKVSDNNPLNTIKGLGKLMLPGGSNMMTRENMAEASAGLESKFRVSDKPNFFDDYINPLNMIGGMASNLGQAPLQAQQTGSYIPYITSVGAPLAVGALAGIGANSNKQFINNLTNPVAGIENFKRVKNIKKSNDVRLDRHFKADDIASDSERTLDNALKERLDNLSTTEGRRRLIQQEKEYLEGLPTFQTFNINIPKQAEINADARIFELAHIKAFGNGATIHKEIVETGGYPSSLPYNTAYYKPPKIPIDDFSTVFNSLNVNPTTFPSIGGHAVPGQISLGTNFHLSTPTAMHEIQHGLQRGRLLEVDKRLKNLDFKKPSALLDSDLNALNYFLKGSKGKESSAYLAELRETMKKKGFINHDYDNITPELVEKAYKHFKKNPHGLYDDFDNSFLAETRILDIIKPTKDNFRKIAKELNNLPSVVGGAALIGSQVTNEKAYGGNINDSNSTGNLNSFNVGGLHSQNPYGGIPQGIGNNGKMNTVEEGETSMYIKDIGKFIFSNRINFK